MQIYLSVLKRLKALLTVFIIYEALFYLSLGQEIILVNKYFLDINKAFFHWTPYLTKDSQTLTLLTLKLC